MLAKNNRPPGLTMMVMRGFFFWSCWAVSWSILADDAIRFGWNDEGVAVTVDDQPVNRVLEVISAATGIPVLVDPNSAARLNGTYRKRTLEDLLLDLSPGMVIEYRFDERQHAHIIARVFSTSMVDGAIKQAELRNLVISRERIEQGIVPPVDRPLRYSGIGAAVQASADGTGIFLQPLSPNAPASRAGIRLGDLITAVDGRPVNTFSNLLEITSAIRGPEDTEVELLIRYPDGLTLPVKVRREVFTWVPPR